MPILGGLGGVINSLGLPSAIVIERTTSDVDSDGYATVSAPTLIPVAKALVWPLRGRELLRLAEGDRSKEAIGIILPIFVRTAREGSNERADIAIYTPSGEGSAKRYVVKVAENWLAQVGSFRCDCVREESG
jgi:hypothetical protein